MKNFSIVLLICITTAYGNAQNLVPNPGFEDTLSCPYYAGEINMAVGWSSFSISPDYYHPCGDSGPLGGVPANWVGYQTAYEGIAYAGLLTFDGTVALSNREFIGVHLIQGLIPDTRYFASVYISRADSFPYTCASNKFGFRFSTIAFTYLNPAPVNNFSQIYSDSIIDNSTGWTKIAGSFIADSAYQYLIIGNFYDDLHTDTINCHLKGAYYYIDQVCVSVDSSSCATNTGMEVDHLSKNLYVYPNPASNVLIFGNLSKETNYLIHNSIGQTIGGGSINKQSNQVDLSSIVNGIYIIETEGQHFKILITH